MVAHMDEEAKRVERDNRVININNDDNDDDDDDNNNNNKLETCFVSGSC